MAVRKVSAKDIEISYRFNISTDKIKGERTKGKKSLRNRGKNR